MSRTKKRVIHSNKAVGPAINVRQSGKLVKVKQEAGKLSFREVVADELDYAKDMFLMPFVTVKEAVVSGLRRNALEIQKYRGRTVKSASSSLRKSGN